MEMNQSISEQDARMTLSHSVRPVNLCIAYPAKESIIDRAEDRRLLPADHTSTNPRRHGRTEQKTPAREVREMKDEQQLTGQIMQRRRPRPFSYF
jgi:hypothetical protein